MKGQQTQHTPGPWKFDEVWHLILGPAGEEVAALHSGQGSNIKRNKLEVVEENARLIAAVPELLEALQLMLKSDEAIEQNLGLKSDQAMLRIAAIDQARAAVAKATQS